MLRWCGMFGEGCWVLSAFYCIIYLMYNVVLNRWSRNWDKMCWFIEMFILLSDKARQLRGISEEYWKNWRFSFFTTDSQIFRICYRCGVQGVWCWMWNCGSRQICANSVNIRFICLSLRFNVYGLRFSELGIIKFLINVIDFYLHLCSIFAFS